jgi:CheY-like chemotaxis protein
VEPQDASSDQAAVEVTRGHGERILFVDDEPGLGEVGKRRLTSLGYDVTVASDPMKALEIARTDRQGFDLVITDYSMPRMSGLVLARSLLSMLPNVKIVLLTGFLEDIPDEKLVDAGVRRVIKKPVTGADLGILVAQTLRGE